MEKSADAFRTISEVAEDLGLPQHVLRFWESRFPQIRPLKRAGGRRYYRPADVELLRAIRQLLYEDGYTIKGVQRLLKERGSKAVFLGGRQEVGGDVRFSAADGFEEDRSGVESNGADVLPEERAETGRSAEGWKPDHGVDAGRPSEDAAGLDFERRKALSAALATVEECERILRTARGASL